MRVLLRSSRTRRYYIGLNQSSAQHEEALDFGNVGSAAKFTFEERLADMEIILRYDLCDGQISLPVLAEWCLFEERALRPVMHPAPLASPGSLSACAHFS
jgi:hypothetical protein